MANKPFKYLKTSPTGDSYTPVDETARNRIGDLSQLTTEHKSNLVEAINEAAESGGGGSAELPSGGAKGDVLTKLSSQDDDYGWERPIVVLTATGNDDNNLVVNWSQNYSTFDLFSRQEMMRARYKYDYFLDLLESYITSTVPDNVSVYHFVFTSVIEIGENSVTIGILHVTSDNAVGHSGTAVFQTKVIGNTTSKEDIGLGNVDNIRQYSAINPPPYPVTSVNGQTGAVELSLATDLQVQNAVDNYLADHPTITGTFTNEAKRALITLLEKVAYIDGNGRDYLDSLEATLFAATVTSITATFTQGANVIYTNDSLDVLRDYLVVTADYSDGTSETVTTYTLSGVLAEGTQTITVTYSGQSDTFTVNCTVKGFLYHFEQSIASSGSKDFGWSGALNYGTGYDDTGYSYEHLADSVSDSGSIKNTSLSSSQKPDLSSDFTISGWSKAGESSSSFAVYILSSIKYNTTASSTNVTNALSSSSIENLASGWTADVSGAVSARYKGLRFQTISGNLNISLFASDGTNRAGVNLTPPETLDWTEWHHYALTRKNGVVRLFVDGNLICNFTYTKALYFNSQVVTAAAFKADAEHPSDTVTFIVPIYVDDIFVTDYAKWDAPFNPTTITY